MTSTIPQIAKVINTVKPPHSATCAELMIMAELELAAFLSAVKELHGVEQAETAGAVWLEELGVLGRLPGAASRDWRQVTVAALGRLGGSLTDTKVSPIPLSNCSASMLLL